MIYKEKQIQICIGTELYKFFTEFIAGVDVLRKYKSSFER